MPISIFHIGLPLNHPSIPTEERPKVTQKLTDLHHKMTAAGYTYQIIFASPETGLEDFKHKLRTEPPDAVLIGGGVASDPALTYFMEQIIDATHQVAPHAKILFYNHSVDPRITVGRWFQAPST